MKGVPWHPHEWLGELLFGKALREGGWAAVVICASAAFAAGTSRFVAIPFALSRTDLTCWVRLHSVYSLLAPHLLARPHVLMMPLLVLWGIGLMNAHDETERQVWA